MRTKLTVALASAFATMAIGPVRAQTTPEQYPADRRALPTVTVNANADASVEGLPAPYAGGQVSRGGRIGILGNQDYMDTPFNNLNFTQELIQNQQARSVGEVLLNDPSVRTTRGFGNFQQAYFIRGFPVFSDDVAYNGLYGLVPRQYLATEFIERVEVFRGANTFISGSGGGVTGGGGLGGIINVVPKRATASPITQLTAGYGTGGEKYIATDIARRFGPDQSTGIRFNAAHRGNGTAVHEERNKLDAVSLGFDWRSSRVRLSADIGYQNNKLDQTQPSVTYAAGVAIGRAPKASRNFAQPWTFSDERDYFGTVRGEFDLAPSTTLWVAGGARRTREMNELANPTVNDALGNTTSNRFDTGRRDYVQSGEAGIRTKFRTGPVDHTVVASMSALRLHTHSGFAFSAGPASNLYNPVDSPEPAQGAQSSPLEDPRTTERINNTSFALVDTLSMADGRVLMTVGARHQRIRDRNYNFFTGAKAPTFNEARVTPVAGAVFKMAPELSFYANYIEGLVKVTAPFFTPAGALVANPGQEFGPTRTKQQELGLKYDSGKLGGAVSVFQVTQPTGQFDAANVFSVDGEQRNRGLELTGYGVAAPGLRLLGGVTFIKSKYRGTGAGTSGNEAIGVPDTQANLGFEWDLPWVKGLGFDARVVHTSSQYADGLNTQKLPSWTRVDVGARYRTSIGSQVVTFRGRVDNVGNNNYWQAAGGFPGAGYLTLGAPRTVLVNASVDF